MTGISHPVFPLILESLEKGFNQKACLYGCGGTIPFVEKLMQALNRDPKDRVVFKDTKALKDEIGF